MTAPADDPAGAVGPSELTAMLAVWLLLVPDGMSLSREEASAQSEWRRTVREAVLDVLQHAPWVSSEVRDLMVQARLLVGPPAPPLAASFLDADAAVDAGA